jgi:hypothetical protein
MFARKSLAGVLGSALMALFAAAAGGQITVYDNFGAGHDGWDYDWGLGWTVAGEDVTAQYGVEQAMGFTSTASGPVSDIWVAMWYVPLDAGYDEVTVRLARNPDDLPPTDGDVMEEWTITEFESWTHWSPPHHLEGDGSSYLVQGESYWLWAVGGETTWAGWCVNSDPGLTCPHTLRREGEDWLPIGDETASAFRVDLAAGCSGDVDGDGDTDLGDLAALLAAYDTCTGDPGFDPAADFDASGCVDLSDLAFLLADYGCGG